MNFMTRIKALTFISLGLYFIIIPLSVHAFSVSPPILEVEAGPGEAVHTKIHIQNTSNTKKIYTFTIQKFIAKGESGQQTFLPPTETAGLPEWMYFDRPALELAPGAAFDLPVVIRVPTNADAGGQYAAVLFAEQAELANGTVGIVPRTGTLVFLTVRGNILKSFSVGTLQSDVETVSHLPANFSLTVKNLGNVHIQPTGKLRVQNMFGNTVASYPLNETGGRILPGSQRIFYASWTRHEPLLSSWMSELNEEIRNFGFGRYTVEATITVDATTQVVTKEIWIWPWMILSFLGFVFAVVVGTLLVRKRMRT